MELQLTTQSFILLMLLGLIWTVFSLAVIVFAKMIYEKIIGDKQIIKKLMQEKIKLRANNLDLVNSQNEIKKELQSMIESNKKFQFSLEPTPQSKQLDKFFNRFSNIN